MKLKVMILTRPWQPEAALMAWRLIRAGADVSVMVETRPRLSSRRKNFWRFFKILLKAGFYNFAGMAVRAFQIRVQFWMRKALKRYYANDVYRSPEEFALDHAVRIVHVKNQNDEVSRKILSESKPDAGIVIKARRPDRSIQETARLGFYGIHLGELEKYSGPDPIFRALASGDRQITVTVYRFSAERNQRTIAAEQRLSVFPFDDSRTLHEKSLWIGTYLAVRNLKEIASGMAGMLKPLTLKPGFFSWPSAKTRRQFQKKRRPPEAASGPDKIRVLHVITRLVRGGAQKNTLATVIGLVQKGYGVTLVTGPSWGSEDEILREALERDLEVLILPELVREIRLFADFRAALKLYGLMRRFPYSIVHTHTSKAGLLGRLAARWAGVPRVVHTPHGHVFHSYFSFWKEKVFLLSERFAARWTLRLVALTKQCRNEHLTLRVGRKEQWTVIPSGVEEKTIEDFSACRNEILESFKIPSGRKIIGYIGRLAPVKGCSHLIRALLPVYWAKIAFHCLIVGDGEEREELERFSASIGLKGRVTFAGYQEDVSRFLSVFDILVVPSLNEGMGRVLVEAGFLAKPVVASNVGGIPDLIENEKTGILVPPHLSDSIAGAVIYLLENPSEAAKFGEGLRKKMLEGFTEVQMIEKIHRLYAELLSGPATREPEKTASPEEEPALKENAR